MKRPSFLDRQWRKRETLEENAREKIRSRQRPSNDIWALITDFCIESWGILLDFRPTPDNRAMPKTIVESIT